MQLLFASPWLWISLLCMLADWLATGFQWKAVRNVTKPAALILLIVWFSTVSGWRGPTVWFGLGLVFSLLGDIFLLQPERGFIFGLAAFLAGHLCYILGFNTRPVQLNSLFFLPLAVTALAGILVGRYILRGLKRGKTHSRMKTPLLMYMLVIGMMVISALACFFRPTWPWAAAALSSLGAISFMTSDSILASDRFVRQRWWAGVTIMVTYHLGQVMIISGALLALSESAG